MSKFYSFQCTRCLTPFSTKRGLSLHWNRLNKCTIVNDTLSTTDKNPNNNQIPLKKKPKRDNTFTVDDCTNDFDTCFSENNYIDNKSAKKPFIYSNDTKVEVKLLHLLNDIGAPKYAFKVIMEWAHEAYVTGYKFQPKCTSQELQVKRIERWLNMTNCQPFQKNVTLPPDNLELKVTCFPFIPMLESLFNDPEINHNDNLVQSKHGDPFSKYISPNGKLGEVNSGKWYKDAYKLLIKDKEKDCLCPIIFAMDKTTISNMASLQVFAIMFTTTLFNLKVCYNFLSCH